MAVDYFRMNLNKASNRLDLYQQKRRKKQLLTVGAYVALIALISAVALYSGYLTKSQMEAKRKTIAELDRKIAALESSEAYISQEDVFALADLVETRFLWAQRLARLAEVLPEDIALNGGHLRSGASHHKGNFEASAPAERPGSGGLDFGPHRGRPGAVRRFRSDEIPTVQSRQI